MRADITTDLIETIEQIEAAVQHLIEQLQKTQITAARVFELPRLTPEEEDQPYGFIEVTAIDGHRAIDTAFTAWASFYGAPGYSTKAVYRCPGVLCVDTDDPKPIITTVNTINDLKGAFHAIAQEFPDRNTRVETLHAALPWLIYLQVTREILAIQERLFSATFTWGVKSSSSRTTKDEQIKRLRSMRHDRPAATADDHGLTWPERLELEVNRLESLPDTSVLHRYRRLKVRPLLNLALERKVQGIRQKWLREAHTPALLINSGRPRIGNLKHYSADRKRKKRSGNDARRPVSILLPDVFEEYKKE